MCLVSVRAYGAEEAFKTESLTRIDVYTRAAVTCYNLNRYRLDLFLLTSI